MVAGSGRDDTNSVAGDPVPVDWDLIVWHLVSLHFALQLHVEDLKGTAGCTSS
jgi:hypothetical protein